MRVYKRNGKPRKAFFQDRHKYELPKLSSAQKAYCDGFMSCYKLFMMTSDKKDWGFMIQKLMNELPQFQEKFEKALIDPPIGAATVLEESIKHVKLENKEDEK